MAIIGVSIDKINIEKSTNKKGIQNINNNISLKDLEIKDVSLGNDDSKGIAFHYEYNCKYMPNESFIKLNGVVIHIDKKEEIEKVKNQWDKEKKINYELMEKVLNAALSKGNIFAIKVADDLGLPPPVRMPRFVKNESDNKTERKSEKEPNKK